jgi:hypothetical protein
MEIRRSLRLRASIADALVIRQQAGECGRRHTEPQDIGSDRAEAQPSDDQK